tara:strand:- start:333 stop:1991 length:1659 start_codon:yes stop_codon:yes gene_type:complete
MFINENSKDHTIGVRLRIFQIEIESKGNMINKKYSTPSDLKNIDPLINFDPVNIVEVLGIAEEGISFNGTVSIDWLHTTNMGLEGHLGAGDTAIPALLDTQNRAYQREKVATDEWKSKIIRTVLENNFKKIPEIHLRLVKKGKSYLIELVDGQQRVTSILDFLSGEFSLPSHFIIKDGDMTVDLSGKNAVVELPDKEFRDRVVSKILRHHVKCTWYENITDEETSDLFIDILNNTNPMKPQVFRNAVLGKLSDYVRDTARPVEGVMPHNLFERQIKHPNTAKEKEVMKLFNINLSGHMEMDEWLTELIYLKKNGLRNGIKGQTQLTNWWKDIQRNGEYKNEFINKNMIDKLLDFSYNIVKAGNDIRPKKMNSMHTLVLILYADELKNKYGEVQYKKYVSKFFEVYDKWNAAAYVQRQQQKVKQKNGTLIPEFSKLFNGKNQNAMYTICYILDIEFKQDPDSWGIIEKDPRETFDPRDVERKWAEQGKICFYDKLPLSWEDAVGDHYVPRSWGIKLGGITEYSNLVVTSHIHNKMKGNTHGDDYLKKCQKKVA